MPVDVAILRFGVHNPRLHGIDRRVESIAAVNHVPVFVGDAVARQGLARPAPASVVLQSAANVIGLLVVQRNFVKLPDGDGVDEIPAAPVVVAPVNSAVAPGDDVIRIRRINPHRVKIAVNSFHPIGSKFFPAVLGVKHLRAQLPNPQIIVGVNANLAVIRRPRIGVAHLFPRLALVVAAKRSAFFVLHHRVDDVRVLAINVEADAADISGGIFVRQSLGQFPPGRSAVGGFVNAAVRATSVESVRRAPPLIGRRI